MKRAILLLLLANLGLFAWQHGAFGPTAEAGREPQRLARQIAPESIRLLTPDQLATLRTGARAEDGAKPACFELGDFDDASLARIQARLDALSLGDRLRARRIQAAGWFIVYMPPAGARAEAERLAQDLRGRGIRDLVVMGQNSQLPNAILLGSFRDRELAQRHQADLTRRGLKGVEMAERASGVEATRFEIRDADATVMQQLAEVQREFPQSQLGICPN